MAAEDRSDDPRRSRVWPLAAALAVALSTLFKIQGFDIWWHVRTGRWIFENRAIPYVDPFSSTADGPWASSGALAQLYFFACDALGGGSGLVVGKVLIVGLLGWLVVRLADEAKGGCAALVVALWGLASHFRFVVRPHLFSFVAFALLLLVLRRTQQTGRARTLAWVPLIVAVACNFHRGGTLALPILAIAVVMWAWDPQHRRLALPALLTLVASTLATLLNQGGLHTLTSTFSVSASEVFARHITEWYPLTPDRLVEHFPAFGVLVVAWGAAALHRRRIDLEVAIVAFTLVLGASKVRFLPYPALAMVPGVARGAHALASWLAPRIAPAIRPALFHAGLATAALALTAAAYAARTPLPAWGPGVAEWRVPIGAARFLAANPPPGALWHDFELGGYLLYALSPDVKKVFIDGRNDKVYRPEFFEETVEAKHDPRVLSSQLEQWNIGVAVTMVDAPGSTRHQWLYRHPDWQLVYWDDYFAVMVRRTPESARYLAEHGYPELRVGATFERLARLDTDPRGAALAADVLRNLEQAPDSARAHYMAALVHRAQGREAAYREAREQVRRFASARELSIELP